MTYQRNNTSRALELAEFTMSGAVSVGGYLTLTSLQHNYSAVVSGSGSSTLTLPAGYYLARATASITRSTSADNFTFEIEVDGSIPAAARRGQTGWYDNTRSDFAEAPFELSSSGGVRVKVNALETASAPVLTSNSRLWLWRTA